MCRSLSSAEACASACESLSVSRPEPYLDNTSSGTRHSNLSTAVEEWGNFAGGTRLLPPAYEPRQHLDLVEHLQQSADFRNVLVPRGTDIASGLNPARLHPGLLHGFLEGEKRIFQIFNLHVTQFVLAAKKANPCERTSPCTF